MTRLMSIVASIVPGAATVRPLTLDDAFREGERYGRVEVGGRLFDSGYQATICAESGASHIFARGKGDTPIAAILEAIDEVVRHGVEARR